MGSIFMTPDINRASNIGDLKGNDNVGFFPPNMIIDEGVSVSRVSNQRPQGSININTKTDSKLERVS